MDELTFERSTSRLREEEIHNGNDERVEGREHCSDIPKPMIMDREGSNAPMYVPQPMLLNEGPVTITTTKLNVQLDAVLNAFAGCLIRRPTISAGCVNYHDKVRDHPVQQDFLSDTHVEPGHAEPSDGEE